MSSADNGFHIHTNGIFNRIGPTDERERAHYESLIAADYQRCHPGETFEDLKRRGRFSKEDAGLAQDWMATAAERAAAERERKIAAPRRAA